MVSPFKISKISKIVLTLPYIHEQKHVLLFRKSSLWGCYKPRHVTKRDVFLFINSKPYWTALLYSLIVQPYCTALLYSFIEQPYWTALLYNPIVQPYCTALLNNLIGHPMLLTETLYGIPQTSN